MAFATKMDRPQWAILHDHLTTLDIDDILTLEELTDLLPGTSLSSARTALYRATKELETTRKRTLDAVRGVGYRVVHPTEHDRLGRSAHRKARKALGRGLRKVRATDVGMLDHDQRQRLDALELQFSRQTDMMRRLDTRVRLVERDTTVQAQVSDEHADRIARLEDLLRRHGLAEDKPSGT